MLTLFDKKVIIVCLNNFLAHWGRMNYGSLNVENDKITYMSIDHFIKRKPNSNVHVIFDEIDSMLGVNSLSLIEK